MFVRFLLVGGAGFLVDAGLTHFFILLTAEPWFARIPAIFISMTCTWFANRTFTFEIRTARSVREAFHYIVVAVSMALANYLMYVVLVERGLWPIAAIALSSIFQAILSFYGYRHIVFGRSK